MLNYFYQCEVNLNHPKVEEAMKKTVMVSADVRVASFVSRPFQHPNDVYESVENDLKDKIKSVIGTDPGIEVTKVSEMNPLHTNSPQDIEERKEDTAFIDYLSTWDDATMCKVTCTTEDLSFDDDGDLVELPKDFVFKYYIRSFDDGIVSPKAITVTQISSTIN